MNWLRKLFNIREESSGDTPKPFLDHLEELRVMIFKMLAAMICGTIISFFFLGDMIRAAEKPLAPYHIDVISIEMADGFMTTLKMAFYAGIVIAFPALLWFLAGFVLPALTRKEKKLLLPGIFGGTVLFIGGVVGAYEFVLPKAVGFFQKWNEDHGFHLKEVLLGKYFSFVVNMLLACGLLCEVPVVILVLARLGLVSYQLLARTRSYAFVILLILIAVIAPSPDPFTFLCMGLPALGVYELCIWLVWVMERRREKEEARQH